MLDITRLDLNSLQIDGIDISDYPDFVDAFVSYGVIRDNEDCRDLTEEELDEINSEHQSLIQELVYKRLF